MDPALEIIGYMGNMSKEEMDRAELLAQHGHKVEGVMYSQVARMLLLEPPPPTCWERAQAWLDRVSGATAPPRRRHSSPSSASAHRGR